MKPHERLRSKKELYSLNQWLLAQNNWVLVSKPTGRQSAGYIIPHFFLVLPSWTSLSHDVATILVTSWVAWIPPCPCSIPTGYWSAINPVQLIICLMSLDSNPGTTPRECGLFKHQVTDELVFICWADYRQVCTQTFASCSSSTPSLGWSIVDVVTRFSMSNPASWTTWKSKKIETNIPWSVCILSFVQICLHSQRIYMLEFT